MNRSGSMLMELLIVVGILSMILVPCSVLFRATEQVALRQSIDLISLATVAAVHHAVATGAPSQITFPTSTTWSWDDVTVPFSGAVRVGLQVGMQGPPGRPVRAVAKAITFQRNAIIGHPQGTVSPGTVYLISPGTTHAAALTARVGLPLSRAYWWEGDSRWRLL